MSRSKRCRRRSIFSSHPNHVDPGPESPVPGLRIFVELEESKKVQGYESEIKKLLQDLEQLKSQFNHVEYLYRCEVLINLQLMDFCRQQGITIPRKLMLRPREEDMSL